MQRDHRLRPKFSDLAQELRELSRLEQQGIDMDTYAKPVTVLIPPTNRWRSLSLGARLARPSMPQASCSSNTLSCICSRSQFKHTVHSVKEYHKSAKPRPARFVAVSCILVILVTLLIWPLRMLSDTS